MTDALATHERTDVRTFLGVTGGKQRSHGPPAGLAGVARGLFPNPGPLAPRPLLRRIHRSTPGDDLALVSFYAIAPCWADSLLGIEAP
jgi:hypothetical protein